jgi:hypothetical protein
MEKTRRFFIFVSGLWHGVLGLQFRKRKARIQLHSERIENAFFIFPNRGHLLDFGWGDEWHMF